MATAKNIATIEFKDTESQDDAVATVRSTHDTVLLALSLMSDGDIEVRMTRDVCEQLIAALKNAIR